MLYFQMYKNKQEDFKVKKGIKTLAMWLIIGVIVIVLLSSIMENSSSKITYSELITSIENSDVESVTISSAGTTTAPTSSVPALLPDLI